jgi:hypothetical protein
LQSNYLRNKYKAEIPKDSGSLGIEFTLNQTITDFIRGAERVNLDYVQSFAEFLNVLQGRLLSDWKQVLEDNFPEQADPEKHDRSMADSFKHAIELIIKHTLNEKKQRDRQWIYISPGGDYRVRKDLLVSPLDHLHRFKEMLQIAQMLPEGDIPNPKALLQVEWFNMTFHRSNRMEYLRSGRKLCDETLATLAAYLESGFDRRVADGTIRKLRDEQVCVKACNKYPHKLQARYTTISSAWQTREDVSTAGGATATAAITAVSPASGQTTASTSQTPGTTATARRLTNRPPRSPVTCMGLRQSIRTTSAVQTLKISAAQTTTTTTSARTMPTTTTSANMRAGMTLVRTLPNPPSPAMGR